MRSSIRVRRGSSFVSLITAVMMIGLMAVPAAAAGPSEPAPGLGQFEPANAVGLYVTVERDRTEIDGGGAVNPTVSVVVKDAPGGTELFSDGAVPVSAGFFSVDTYLTPNACCLPGQEVTVTDGLVVKVLEVADITVGAISETNDWVSGTAPTGAQLQVGVDSSPALPVEAFEPGVWLADFSQLYDVASDSLAYVFLEDPDGDATLATADWSAVTSGLRLNYVRGADTIGGELAYAGTVFVWWTDTPGGEMVGAQVLPTAFDSTFEIPDLYLHPGSEIFVDDGPTLKSLIVTPLQVVQALHGDFNTAWGFAAPGSSVDVWAPVGTGDEYQGLSVTADPVFGYWLADFASAGFDVNEWRDLFAVQTEPDGDQCVYQVLAADPAEVFFYGGITDDVITVIGPVGTEVTTEVRDGPGGSPLYQDVSTIGAEGSYILDPGFDLTPGMEIFGFTADEYKMVLVEGVNVDSMDAGANTVTGTGPPHALMDVSAYVGGIPVGQAPALTSGAGTWTADFTGIVDLQPEDIISATLYDHDGDGTYMFLAPTPCSDDVYEENDTQGTATALVNGVPVSAVSCGGDEDWFSLDVAAGEVITAEALFTHANGDLDIGLFDPSGVLVDAGTTGDDNETIVYSALLTGSYAVVVVGTAFEGNSYDLTVTAAVPTTPSGGDLVVAPDVVPGVVGDELVGAVFDTGGAGWSVVTRESGDGSLVSSFLVENDFVPIDLEVFAEGSAWRVATLGVKGGTSVRVQVNDLTTGAHVRNVSFGSGYVGVDAEVVTVGGVDFFAVLSQRISDGKIRVSRTSVDGGTVAPVQFFLSTRFTPVDLEVWADGVGEPDLVVVGSRTDTKKVRIEAQEAGIAGVETASVGYGKKYTAVDLQVDPNGDFAVLGERYSDGKVRVRAKTPANTTTVNILFGSTHVPLELAIFADTGTGPSFEYGVLGVSATNQARVWVKDSDTGVEVSRVNYGTVADAPRPHLGVASDLGGGSTGEEAVVMGLFATVVEHHLRDIQTTTQVGIIPVL